MIQGDERILVIGHRSPIGAALLRRLVRLGHPRNRLLTRSFSDAGQAAESSLSEFLIAQKPDLVCLVDSNACSPGNCACTTEAELESQQITPREIMQIARDAGVEKLIHIATAAIHSGCELVSFSSSDIYSCCSCRQCRDRENEALQTCASFSQSGLDYRSLQTCEPYGPLWPLPTTAYMGRVAKLIEHLLQQFRSAELSKLDSITIKANAADRVELMFTNDIADAIVHILDLPRSALESDAQSPASPLQLGADREVELSELIHAVALASGFHGRVVIEPAPSAFGRNPLTSRGMAQLGWRPLIELDTGLELTAMDFRLRQIATRGAKHAVVI
ncbi:MAG: NAD-dependent epimerase/dehydratase family protein [Hydrogenophaga sp.]|uniref:NAD-dependent epimerase/dehydratase family protein n=1 Tax=Hydrogenophaga sp. TaxID=1904254 RepID=UPI002733F899|nr:NAD-dependent epimerase/dehydratase family protein [Hydrogenophaga sp.]MDP3348060.1 NAD-dependent epimerase/dehydratase family protein [Hydrogenophaga sp.]